MSRSDGLRVWQAARELAEQITTLTQAMPNNTPAKLRTQLVSAANSVSANIAEGVGRGTPGEKARFFRISRGSLEETQNYLRVLVNTALIDRATFYPPWHRSVLIGRMLAKLIDKLGRS